MLEPCLRRHTERDQGVELLALSTGGFAVLSYLAKVFFQAAEAADQGSEISTVNHPGRDVGGKEKFD